MNTKPDNPAYSTDCIRASSGGKPSQRMNTGATASWLASNHDAPSGSGSSQGKTQAATISSTLPSPDP